MAVQSSTKKWVFIGGGLIAAALVVVFFQNYPPKPEDAAGTIGAAQRYHEPQITGADVKVDQTTLDTVIQSDAFDRIMKDPEARKLFTSAAMASVLNEAAGHTLFAASGGVKIEPKHPMVATDGATKIEGHEIATSEATRPQKFLETTSPGNDAGGKIEGHEIATSEATRPQKFVEANGTMNDATKPQKFLETTSPGNDAGGKIEGHEIATSEATRPQKFVEANGTMNDATKPQKFVEANGTMNDATKPQKFVEANGTMNDATKPQKFVEANGTMNDATKPQKFVEANGTMNDGVKVQRRHEIDNQAILQAIAGNQALAAAFSDADFCRALAAPGVREALVDQARGGGKSAIPE